MIVAMRPHQWTKSLLLLLVPIMAHAIDIRSFTILAVAILAQSLIAASGYVLNDLIDRASDRLHPVKQSRPFACEVLSVRAGALLCIALFAAGLLISLAMLPTKFMLCVLGYFALTVAYSIFLKRIIVVDVACLGVLYTLRVFAGGSALDLSVSIELASFSFLFFVGLSTAKRYGELMEARARNLDHVIGRGYHIEYTRGLLLLGLACGLSASLVLFLHLNGPEVGSLHTHPEVLSLIAPVTFYWNIHLWRTADRNGLEHDPVLFALRDWKSYLSCVIAIVCVLLAA
jgi:4-hydroxybenzoate polyprenyltransferase